MGVFHVFLNCLSGTKPHKASHIGRIEIKGVLVRIMEKKEFLKFRGEQHCTKNEVFHLGFVQ